MKAIAQFSEDTPGTALTLYRKPEIELYEFTRPVNHFRQSDFHASSNFRESAYVLRSSFMEMIREAWAALRVKRIAAGETVASALETALHAIVSGLTTSAKFIASKVIVPSALFVTSTVSSYASTWASGGQGFSTLTSRPWTWVGNSREIEEAEAQATRVAKRRAHADDVFEAELMKGKIGSDKEVAARETARMEELREKTAIKFRNAAYRKRAIRSTIVGAGGLTLAAASAAASAFLAYNLSIVADAGIFTSVLATVPFALGKYGKRSTKEVLPTVDRSTSRAEEPITDTFVVEAFRKLPHAGFGENIELLSPIKESADGNGWSTSLELPGILTLDKLKGYQVQLEKLLRAPVGGLEIVGDPVRGSGFVILRVSDLHASQRQAATWPLLELDHLNFFDPLPVGFSPMGEIGTISIAGKNVFGCGISDSGKSESWEKLAFSALMDPIVEARFVCGKHINEFGLLADAASVSIYGDPSEDDQVARDFYRLLEITRADVAARGKILDARGLGEKKVTEELARTVPGLHPIVIPIDEYHKFRNHKTLGADVQALMMEIVTQSRFVMIHFLPLVQSIIGQGIPTPFVTQHQRKIGFRTGVVDVTALNDGGSHANGMNPSEIPEDLPGTAIISGARPITIRFFNPSQAEKIQVARKIVAMRGGPVRKLDLSPKTKPVSVDEMETDSPFPHLLKDIIDMERPIHKGRLQGLEILPLLPKRPEYKFKDYNHLNQVLREMTKQKDGSNLVGQINKVAEGGTNKQGIVIGEVRRFIEGSK